MIARARNSRRFFSREDTFALGVCNGCQMMSNLHSIIPGSDHWPRFVQNQSERYEGRFVSLKIEKSPSILFTGMEGSVYRSPSLMARATPNSVTSRRCSVAAIPAWSPPRYVDNHHAVTEQYPLNPNGSPRGMTRAHDDHRPRDNHDAASRARSSLRVHELGAVRLGRRFTLDAPVLQRPRVGGLTAGGFSSEFFRSQMKSTARDVFIGTDSGATTSKTGGVWADGSPISLKLRQSSTNSQLGTAAVIAGWVEGVADFSLTTSSHGIRSAAWDWRSRGRIRATGCSGKVRTSPCHSTAGIFTQIFRRAGPRRPAGPFLSSAANDGNYGGVGEAARARGDKKASVLMLAPGSGLGAAYIDANGFPLDGDTLSGMEGGHMPAPLHMLGGIRPFTCGCGRDWGLHRGLHDHFRIAAAPRGIPAEISAARTRHLQRADQGKGSVAPDPGAKGRSAGTGDFRFSGARTTASMWPISTSPSTPSLSSSVAD